MASFCKLPGKGAEVLANCYRTECQERYADISKLQQAYVYSFTGLTYHKYENIQTRFLWKFDVFRRGVRSNDLGGKFVGHLSQQISE